MYLVDFGGQWEIQDIMSMSQDSLFLEPIETKVTVYAVEKGSPAEKSGILPGDEIVSLADEVDTDYAYHIGHDRLNSITTDTSIVILREDSSLYFLPAERIPRFTSCP
jgi:C-terminal processing protease CtpA/Prc